MAAQEGVRNESIVTWSPVVVTLLFSFFQGCAFFLFFLFQRWRKRKQPCYDLYEARMYKRRHRSPPPFGQTEEEEHSDANKGIGMFAWAVAAYQVDNEELLRCVGLDSYMFLRFLRLGFRMSLFGGVLGCVVLIPLYATGEQSGPEALHFNSITISHVALGSPRLVGTAICWYLFVAFVLRDLWLEWKHFAVHRYEFLARGDVDTDRDYRYAVMAEYVPSHLQSNLELRNYFERMFPGKVRQVSICLDTTTLDALVAERLKLMQLYEVAQAKVHAFPQKPRPTIRAPKPQKGKIDALAYYHQKIQTLNAKIDAERRALHAFVDERNTKDLSKQEESHSHFVSGLAKTAVQTIPLMPVAAETGLAVTSTLKGVVVNTLGGNHADTTPDDAKPPPSSPTSTTNTTTTSTAFITFSSLRAKQCAVQCNLNGKTQNLDLHPAPEPNAVLWRNITIPASTQRISQLQVSGLWTAGTLFWAIPMTLVNSLANLDSILKSLGIHHVDTGGFVYGFVSGLVPVLALQFLMWILPKLIQASAYYIIRIKSQPDIDSYTFYWHQMYQFANLWFILIGGSLFNQINALLKDPTQVIELVTSAMTGSSIFFVDMMIWNTFASFGMELSLLPAYGMTLVRNVLQPEATRTQRMMDAAKTAESIPWGNTLPPMVFVYLLAMVYMHMVPIMEVFALVYFGGAYVVWKHQCLHVYAQEVEGGGVIWQELWRFLMGCLYMAELVFIGMMGIKNGSVHFVMGFIPLVCTVLVHRILHRTVITPLGNLALSVAATIDLEEGELEVTEEDYARGFTVAVERQLYAQPVLKSDEGEREPMPYRRHEVQVARGFTAVREEEEDEDGDGEEVMKKGGLEKGDGGSNTDSQSYQDCSTFVESP